MAEDEKKLMDSSSEEKTDDSSSEEDEKFLNETPTRKEVVNFITGVMEDKYMPTILGLISQLERSQKLNAILIETILLNKNVCTQEDLENATHGVLEAYKKELESQKTDSKSKTEEPK